MPELSGTVSSISNALLGEAARIGGDLWTEIGKAARFYVKGYTQAVIDISRAVALGEMNPEDGANSAKSAAFFFYMMIAQETQATLAAIQRLIDSAMSLLRDRINAVLPFPVL